MNLQRSNCNQISKLSISVLHRIRIVHTHIHVKCTRHLELLYLELLYLELLIISPQRTKHSSHRVNWQIIYKTKKRT